MGVNGDNVSIVVKHWKVNQCLAGFIITLGGFSFGCGLSWTATALPSFDKTDQVGFLTATEKSWIASFFALGALLTCPLTGLYITNLGRKTSLLGFTSVGFLGWLLLGSATAPLHLYLGRLLIGISTGGYTIVVPIYIGEIASKEDRGKLGSMFVLMLCLGKLFSNGIGILFPANIASFLCAIHPCLYTVLLLLVPESPKFLLKQGKFIQAHDSLNWLETTGVPIPFTTNNLRKSRLSQEIWTKLQSLQLSDPASRQSAKYSIGGEPDVTIMDFFKTRELLLPSFIVFVQMLLAQFCGINVSTFFTVEIFRYSGNILICPEQATLILAIIQTFGCLPCSMCVDKYGRKVLITSSLFTMSWAMLGMAIFFFLKSNLPCVLEKHPLFELLPITCLIIYNLAYSWGIGSVVWIIMSELLPPKIAGPASAVSTIFYWGGAFCVTKAFQMFETCVPLFIWFAFFSAICALGFSFDLFLLPETKGQSPVEIQEMFCCSKNKQSKAFPHQIINHDQKIVTNL